MVVFKRKYFSLKSLKYVMDLGLDNIDNGKNILYVSHLYVRLDYTCVKS
jgi:hypothetical protein